MRPAHAWVSCSAVAIVAVGVLSPGAAADDKVALGGSAGVTLGGGPLCALTTIGHDRAGNTVGLTSAHCGGVGARVDADGAAGVGSVVAADEALDYAVIRFDPARVAPVADYGGFAINGVGPDASPAQWVCKQSPVGNYCDLVSVFQGRDPDTVLIHGCWNPGDYGAPVTANGLLVGMIRAYEPAQVPCPMWRANDFPRSREPEVVSINAILGDLNAKGGPGAGFAPVG